MTVPAPTPSSGTPVDPGAATRTLTGGDEPLTTDVRAPADRPLPTVPGFRLVRWLGGGGMGDVYEAVDEKHGVTFALKMVRADRASPAFTARFHQEIRALMTLDHPHVVRVFKDDEADGRPYFTMRFVRGGTLADRLPELRADPKAAVRLLVKVIDAVEYLHRQGRVHRDLKPTNVLLDEAGEPYLSDFGLVKDLADVLGPEDMIPASPPAAASTAPDDETLTAPPAPDGRPRTRTGAKLGTYAYMSPEQANGEVHRVGPASDVYALGVILYELLTGRRPERGANNPPPGVDPGLDRIIARCLSADPARRYPSAALLAADLRAWLEPAPPRVRRKRWRIMGVASALVILGVGITLAVLRPKRDAGPDEWRAWARTELRAGRAVTLVDADGNPPPGLRFVLGAGPAKAERDAGGWLGIHTPDTALAELLDDPGVDAFALQAEMRSAQPTVLPRAGLYVAARRVEAPAGDWFFQLEYLYDECPTNVVAAPAPPPVVPGPPAPRGRFKPKSAQLVGNPNGTRELRLHGLRADGRGNVPDRLSSWNVGPDRAEQGGPWRTMVIHARGDRFTVSWDGGVEFTTPEIAAPRLAKLQSVITEWPGPALRFTARGGLGVYVEEGSMAVRNVTIVPAP